MRPGLESRGLAAYGRAGLPEKEGSPVFFIVVSFKGRRKEGQGMETMSQPGCD